MSEIVIAQDVSDEKAIAALGDLLEQLRNHFSAKGNPAKDPTGPGLYRQRHILAQMAVGQFLSVLGSSFAAEFRFLALALEELDRGVVNPVLEPANLSGKPADSFDIWGARALVATALDCYKQARMSNLLTYASTIDIPGVPLRPDDPDCEEFRPVEAAFGKHQLLWLDCLQQVEDGEIKRLLGLMPPGSAKSTYSSIVFPTHYMGRFPGSQIIVANYGSDLPRKWGRKGRAITKQDKYRRIFNTSLSVDSTAADEWALQNGSEYMGAGLMTGVTGNRADGLIWDDLIKGREQADSDIIRNKTWDAYFDDFLPRKKPSAWEIGVTTRWHEDDPAGRILPADYNGESGWIEGRDGNAWFVVCIPAEAESEDDILHRKIGERIWPEWFPEDHFKPFKRNARTWNALYQQRPAPEQGDYFKAEWLRTFEKTPDRKTMRIYGASDYAVSSGMGDFTVHGVFGLDSDGKLYLLDLWRKQASSDEWVESFCDLVLKWKPMDWAEETGQIKAGVGPFLSRRSRERKAYVARTVFPTRGDKAIRAQSIRGYMAEHGLYCPFNAPWFPAFQAELMSFPAWSAP